MPPVNSSKYMVQAGWADVPHIDPDTQRELLENTPPHLRDARSKGTPSLGAGAIYPIEQSEFIVDPFAIPAHFAKGYGMDVGWNRTAAAFGAWDRDNDVLYIYAEHYRGHAEPSVHADSIKARGEWLIGACDWAGTDQSTGERLIEIYQQLGLNVVRAEKGVEAGLLEVWQLLSSGRLKVFRSCQNWLNEHRLYRRDDKGRIVKQYDHLMDATRYLVRLRASVMRTKPVPRATTETFQIADRVGGY